MADWPQSKHGFGRRVAASDALPGSKAAADYVCDGTADDVQINAAIADLEDYGGKVELSEGNFSIASTVWVDKDNTTLCGQGYSAGADELAGTPATKPGGTSLNYASGLTGSFVEFSRASDDYPLVGCQLRDLHIDGANRSGTTIDGVYWRNYRGRMERVGIHYCSGDGIAVEGYAEPTGQNAGSNWFVDNEVRRNGGIGINFVDEAADNNVTGGIYASNVGDGCYANLGNLALVGVHLFNNDGITVNVPGATLRAVGCRISNGGTGGIYFTGSGSASANVISSNFFDGNSRGTEATYDEINMSPSSVSRNSIIIGNYFGEESTGQPRYCIKLGSNCRDTMVAHNAYRPAVAATSFYSSDSATNVNLDDEGSLFVEHGATAGTTRPTWSGRVTWIGSVTPSNALDGDIWIDTT